MIEVNSYPLARTKGFIPALGFSVLLGGCTLHLVLRSLDKDTPAPQTKKEKKRKGRNLCHGHYMS